MILSSAFLAGLAVLLCARFAMADAPESPELASQRKEMKHLLHLGNRPFHRIERFANSRLMLLDPVYRRNKDGSVSESSSPDDYVDVAVPDEELAWVRTEFERDPKTPTPCFTHTVMDVRDSYLAADRLLDPWIMWALLTA